MTRTYVFTGAAGGSQYNDWNFEADTYDQNTGNIIRQVFNWSVYPDGTLQGGAALDGLSPNDPLPTTADDVIIGPAGGYSSFPVVIKGADAYGHYAAAHDLTIRASSSLTLTSQFTVSHAIANAGTITVNGYPSGGTLLLSPGTVSLTGAGILSLASGGGRNAIRSSDPAGLSILDNSSTISGYGRIGRSLDGNHDYYTVLHNHGTVDANSGTGQLLFDPGTTPGLNPITNDGVLKATGGADSNGQQNGLNGLAFFNTNIVQTASGTIGAYGAGSHVNIYGVTIQGGKIDGSGGGVIETGASGTGGTTTVTGIDGGSSAGSVSVLAGGIVAAVGGTPLYLNGALVNQGTIRANDGGGVLRIQNGNTTLTGGGKVLLDKQSSGFGTVVLEGFDANTVSTLHNVDNTILGSGTIGGITNSYNSDGLNFILDNQANGVVNADRGIAGLLLYNMAVTNAGILESTAGFTDSGGNKFGLEIQSSTITQTSSGRIRADGATAIVNLKDATTVIGGSLSTANGGVISTSNNGGAILDGSTAAGALSNLGTLLVPYGDLTLKGSIVNSGSIVLQTGTTQDIRSAGATLTGGGQVTLGKASAALRDGGGRLTNTDNTITGAGTFDTGLLFTQGAAGVVNATSSTDVLHIQTGNTITNSGLFQATGTAGLDLALTTLDDRTGGRVSVGDGSVFTLHSGTILGGSLQGTGTGQFVVKESGNGNSVIADASNAATVKIDLDANLNWTGSIQNTGTIIVDSAQYISSLNAAGTWTGGGRITLSDRAGNRLGVYGTFNNTNNVISGAGIIQGFGGGTVSFTNGGTVDAIYADVALTVATGATVTNNGILEASGGTLSVSDAIAGTGSALVTGGGTLSFASTFNQNVTFQGANAGTLAVVQTYGGKIFNFLAGDKIDLTSLAYSASYTKSFTGNGSGGGTLKIMSGATVVASLALAGSYQSDAFTLANDGAGETLITTTGPSTYALPGDVTSFGPATPSYTRYNDITGNGLGDTIAGNFSGPMTITGGSGADVLSFGANVTGGLIYGGAGNDRIDVSGEASTAASTYLDGGTGNDTLIGGGLNDTIVGNGADSMVGSTVTGAVNQFFDVSNGSTTMIGGAAATNRFHASGGNDRITAGNVGDFAWLTHFGSDTFVGGTGNDTVSSQNSGSNSISTGGGNDLIYSASAHDVISTGDGANTVYAVSADQLLVYGGAGNDVIFVGGTYTATGSGSSTVYNNIQVTGGGGNDTIDGTGGRGVLYIAPGTGSGVNVVNGDDVGNHIYGQFNTGQLFMRGGRGGDEMVGGKGGNTFIGAGGGDFVRAAGVANVFDFNSIGEGGLHIANFNANTDRIGIYAGGFGSQLYGGETLTAGYNLINGSTATQQTGTFLYHDALLFFDPDGTGAIAPTALAGFTAGTNAVPTALSANNFTISGARF